MSGELWSKLESLYDEAASLPAEAHAQFLEERCSGDEKLRGALAAMLHRSPQSLTEIVGCAAAQVVRSKHAESVEAATERLVGGRLGPWRLLSVIGLGGMGTVYRAEREDHDFRQQAAVKVIAGGSMGGPAQRRFREERQILARIEHPNVARLIDGGIAPGGEPFLAMEYVDGIPIDAWCRERQLPMTQRLELFRVVCGAVQFAHQNLIVHCDLKPANILVTRDGMPKLLDFGIARFLERPPEDTAATMWRPLTIDYASPEQLMGLPVTTASDIYSLGILLHELVVERRPYQLNDKGIEQIVSIVCREEVAAPRTGAYDLDAIIQKALRKEPALRYQSAAGLAADVTRYLERRPVEAHRGNWTYRTRKFLRRNRTLAAASVITGCLFLGSVAAVLREGRIARIQRDRAERRFNDVRKLANSLLFDVHDAIRDLPGSTPVRRTILLKAGEYLDGLAREAGNDVSLDRELAGAYDRLAEVQENMIFASLGDTAAASETSRKTLDLRERVAASNPGNITDLVNLAKAHRTLAETIQVGGHLDQALFHMEKAIAISERARRSHPENLVVLGELIADYLGKANFQGGNVFGNLGDPLEAIDIDQNAVALAQQVVAAGGGSPESRLQLGRVYLRLGDARMYASQWSAAAGTYQKAMQVFRELAAEVPESTNLLDQALIYARFAAIEGARGHLRQALAYFEKERDIDGMVLASDPESAFARGDHMWSYALIGDTLSRQGHHAEASAALREARSKVLELLAAGPTNAYIRSSQASFLLFTALALAREGDTAGAATQAAKAIAIFSQLSAGDPSDGQVRLLLATALERQGFLLLQTHRWDDAANSLQAAIQLCAPYRTQQRPNQEALFVTADAYAGLGDLYVVRARESSGTQRVQYLQQAQGYYRQSLQNGDLIHEPSFVTPSGFECLPRSEVMRRAARCAVQLSRLGVHKWQVQ